MALLILKQNAAFCWLSPFCAFPALLPPNSMVCDSVFQTVCFILLSYYMVCPQCLLGSCFCVFAFIFRSLGWDGDLCSHPCTASLYYCLIFNAAFCLEASLSLCGGTPPLQQHFLFLSFCLQTSGLCLPSATAHTASCQAEWENSFAHLGRVLWTSSGCVSDSFLTCLPRTSPPNLLTSLLLSSSFSLPN